MRTYLIAVSYIVRDTGQGEIPWACVQGVMRALYGSEETPKKMTWYGELYSWKELDGRELLHVRNTLQALAKEHKVTMCVKILACGFLRLSSLGTITFYPERGWPSRFSPTTA